MSLKAQILKLLNEFDEHMREATKRVMDPQRLSITADRLRNEVIEAIRVAAQGTEDEQLMAGVCQSIGDLQRRVEGLERIFKVQYARMRPKEEGSGE